MSNTATGVEDEVSDQVNKTTDPSQRAIDAAVRLGPSLTPAEHRTTTEQMTGRTLAYVTYELADTILELVGAIIDIQPPAVQEQLMDIQIRMAKMKQDIDNAR